VSEELRTGRLVRVLSDWRLEGSDVFAMVNRANRRPARAVRFLAMLREALAGPPWRIDAG
jgi:DNA-binding transcriptional LysR family regulator